MANTVLFSFGPLQFKVSPLNAQEADYADTTEYARKQVMGAIPQREWVGEGDSEIILSGQLFPLRVGGFGNLEQLNAMRIKGVANILIRGVAPGLTLGWFVCERLLRRHAFLDSGGIGKVIHWRAMFSRCDEPNPETYFWNLNQVIGP